VNDCSALIEELKLGEDNSDPIKVHPELNCVSAAQNFGREQTNSPLIFCMRHLEHHPGNKPLHSYNDIITTTRLIVVLSRSLCRAMQDLDHVLSLHSTDPHISPVLREAKSRRRNADHYLDSYSEIYSKPGITIWSRTLPSGISEYKGEVSSPLPILTCWEDIPDLRGEKGSPDLRGAGRRESLTCGGRGGGYP